MTHYQYVPRPILLVSLAILLSLIALPQTVHGQAPAPDAYEDNDTLVAASAIPATVTLPNLTISPAQDADFYRIVANPGPLSAQVFGTPGLDLTLNLYDPSGTVIATDNSSTGPNATVAVLVPTTGYYVIEINSTTLLEGYYELRINNAPATPTPTATITPTPLYTPTPGLGGEPDFAEPNYDFKTAYRIAPGSELTGLNFNPGMDGQQDNDFFVMAVRGGIRYSCLTSDLGPNLDTNLIVYHSAGFDDVVGGNDDVDTQSGQINSQVDFTARADADVYILVGYKFPKEVDLRHPGAATYTLTCQAGAPAPPAPVSGGAASGGAGLGITPRATPVNLLTLSQPEATPVPTISPIGALTVDVLMAYDINANGQPDPTEGIQGVSVWLLNAVTGQQLTHGYTDTAGAVRFTIAINDPIRISIPYLGETQEFKSTSPAQWILLIPAAKAPGIIP